MSIQESLELRKKIKSKKPAFRREDWHKKKRVTSTSWRSSKGRHGKMRHGFQGHPATVKPGYGSPKVVRGLHKSGLIIVRICTISELSLLNKAKHAVVISASVGARKKLELAKKSIELGLKVINMKDPAGYVKQIESRINEKKAKKTEAQKKKQDKEKVVNKVEEKKEAPLSAEEAKKKDTKELEKVLTKRAR